MHNDTSLFGRAPRGNVGDCRRTNDAPETLGRGLSIPSRYRRHDLVLVPYHRRFPGGGPTRKHYTLIGIRRRHDGARRPSRTMRCAPSPAAASRMDWARPVSVPRRSCAASVTAGVQTRLRRTPRPAPLPRINCAEAVHRPRRSRRPWQCAAGSWSRNDQKAHPRRSPRNRRRRQNPPATPRGKPCRSS